MTAHSTSANIHLHGPITPAGAVRDRADHINGVPDYYASVDLDKGQISSYVFLEDSQQAFALAETFRAVGHQLATREQTARKDAAAAAAAEKAAADEAEQVTEDTSDHYPSTEGV